MLAYGGEAAQEGCYLLGDKAYISTQDCLAPIKENNRRFTRSQRELFNREHGHVRARVEQSIRMMKQWQTLGARWRHHDTTVLKKCAHIVAQLRNMYCAQYPPYDTLI